MSWPNQLVDCDAYSRFGSAGEPLRWYISQPAKWGPLTSHCLRFPSDVRTNAPLRVPTSTRTRLITYSFLALLFLYKPSQKQYSISMDQFPAACYGIIQSARGACYSAGKPVISLTGRTST